MKPQKVKHFILTFYLEIAALIHHILCYIVNERNFGKIGRNCLEKKSSLKSLNLFLKLLLN